MKLNRWIRTGLCALVLLALLCASALAKTVSPNDDFYYLDEANVLSEALEGEIFFSNKLLYDACGAQIVVVTVKTTGREAIDDYAYELFNRWGIGDASKDNGFLLLLAIDDDDYYALPGSGLDSRFTAGAIKDYYDKYLETDFAAGNYEAGVKKFYEAVFKRIADAYNANVTVAEGVSAYNDYVRGNQMSYGFGGYGGNRRAEARGGGYGERQDTGFGLGFMLVIALVVVLIVVMSKGRRARRRTVVMPPPPPPPMGFGGVGYRPTRTVYRPPYNARPSRPSSGWGGGGFSSGWSSGSSHSSFGGGGHSSGGFSSGRSGGGFGGGHSGGGGSRGGGAGRGR